MLVTKNADARSQLVLQESPQFKARVVHVQAARVVDLSRVSRHLGLSFHESSDRGVVVDVTLSVGAASLDLFVRQLLGQSTR